MHQPHASPCIRPQQPTFHCNFQACESTCIGRQPSSHVRCHTMRAARICKRTNVFLTAGQLQVKCVTCHMSCTASRLQPCGGTYAPSLRQGHYVANKLTLQSYRLTPSSLHCSSIPAAVQQARQALRSYREHRKSNSSAAPAGLQCCRVQLPQPHSGDADTVKALDSGDFPGGIQQLTRAMAPLVDSFLDGCALLLMRSQFGGLTACLREIR